MLSRLSLIPSLTLDNISSPMLSCFSNASIFLPFTNTSSNLLDISTFSVFVVQIFCILTLSVFTFLEIEKVSSITGITCAIVVEVVALESVEVNWLLSEVSILFRFSGSSLLSLDCNNLYYIVVYHL